MEIKAKIFKPEIHAKINGSAISMLPSGGNTGDVYVKGVGWMSKEAFFQAYADSRPEYTDDESAVSGGVGLNETYWVAAGSDSNIPGNFRRVTTV